MSHHSFYFFFAIMVSVVFIFPRIVFARMPNDPNAAQWAYTATGVYQAWNTTTGSRNVIVAIIDDGFDTFHPDLFRNVWRNKKEIPGNGIDDDHNGYIDDVYGWNFVPSDTNSDGKIDGNELKGNNNPRPILSTLTKKEKREGIESHGTIVAGIIGAVGNNRLDGAGINWHIKLMNIKIINNTGIGTLGDLPAAIHYAVDNGANIINLSVVGNMDLLVNQAIKYAYNHGVVVIAAAGNGGIDLNRNPRDPVCADAGQAKQWVLGVSAITQSHHLAQFSDYGSHCIDIAAPGENISSTVRFSPLHGLFAQYAGGWNGTSFAAPMVSGAAALLKGLHPLWGPDQIYEALLNTTHVTAGQDMTIYKNLFGHGLLQINKAVAYREEQSSTTVYSSLQHASSTKKNYLWRIDTENGEVKKIQNQIPSSTKFIPELVGVEAVATAKDRNGRRWFVTAQHVGGFIGEVIVYNEAWQQVAHWGVLYTGSLHLALGSFLGNGKMQIAVASNQSHSLVSLFDMQGLLVQTVGNTTTRYTHIALAVLKNNSVFHTQNLAIGYSMNNTVFLTYFKNATTTQSVPLYLIDSLSDITIIPSAIGVRSRVLVSGATRKDQFMIYYTQGGHFIRLLAPFGLHEHTPIRIISIKTATGYGFAALPKNGWTEPRLFAADGKQLSGLTANYQKKHTNTILLSF